jgi:hypothetical protein
MKKIISVVFVFIFVLGGVVTLAEDSSVGIQPLNDPWPDDGIGYVEQLNNL